jgi:hypothetical protein
MNNGYVLPDPRQMSEIVTQLERFPYQPASNAGCCVAFWVDELAEQAKPYAHEPHVAEFFAAYQAAKSREVK